MSVGTAQETIQLPLQKRSLNLKGKFLLASEGNNVQSVNETKSAKKDSLYPSELKPLSQFRDRSRIQFQKQP